MKGLEFEKEKKPKERTDNRTPVNVFLSDEEKRRFELASKNLSWSLSKFLRVSGHITELLITKRVNNFDEAFERALSEGKEKVW